MMDEKELKCPICFGTGILIHKGTRDNSKIDVYQCHNCGTKFLDKTEQENDYENGFMYEKNQLSDLDIEQRLQVFQSDDVRRYERVKNICAAKKVLDFGCGFGGFLNCISSVTDSYCGVELGGSEREYLREKGIKCFKAIEESNEKYDVITLFHTFEHLSRPQLWLNKFSEYLSQDGYLIIEVPNADDILLSLYESNAFADFTYWSAHLFLYTARSLSVLIEECGKYRIESAEQVQRYTIANHLMWLAKGKPGGHHEWDMLDSKELSASYTRKLQELQMCDTLFFVLRPKCVN